MKKLIIAIVIVLIVGAGWYLASPLFFDSEVNEDFPEFDFPSEEEQARMTEDEREQLEREALEFAAQQPSVVMDEAMPDTDDSTSTDPVLLSTGEFVDQDSFHRGTGSAMIYELPDGKQFVRFEDFEVTNGPDLHVLLAKNPDPNSRGDVQEGYIDLGKLKGNIGNQNYDIPEDVDLSAYNSVVIYCEPFHVIFSVASLN